MTRRRSPGPARSLPGRAGCLVRGAAAFCALAGFTGAVPAVLAHYGGWPLPRHVPAWPQVRAALMTPLTESAILKILACAVWLAWAMFAVSLAVEIIAALRGCPAPRMPVFPGAQALAAALVSALTVTAAAVPYSSASLAPAAAASSVAVTTASFRQPGHQAPVWLSAPWITGSPVNSAGAGAQAHPRDTSSSSTALPEIHHVVPGDNLWDIAGADLGNPEQWHEIYALNRARPQGDGRSLTDPDRIYPGWALLLPPLPPRSAAPMRHATLPEHPASPAAAGHPPGSSHSQHAPGRHRPADRQPPGKASTSTAHPGVRKGAAGIHLPGGGLAGITLAAAVSAAAVLAGVQRSRRYRPGKTETSSLHPGNPPLPAAIATLRRAAGADNTAEDSPWSPAGPRPGTGGLPRTGPRGTGRDPVPSGPGPGGNLYDRDHGHTWETSPGPGGQPLHAAPGGLPAGNAPGEPLAARPGMVPLGIRDGNEISADLAAMGGLGLTGPGAPAAARAILAALLAQALPGQPSGPVEIIMAAADAAVLLPGPHREDISAARLPGLTVTPALDRALDYAEALILRKAREAGSHETGDGPREDAPARPPAAALIATPPRTSQRLRGVLESGRGLAVAGILLGDWPPGITCHVTADGVITSADPALDGIQMFHLDAADSTAVLRLMQAACGNPAGGEDPPAPNPSGPPPAWGSGMAAGVPGEITAATTQRAPVADSGTTPGHDIPAGTGTAPPASAASGPAA
jgi:LysM domain